MEIQDKKVNKKLKNKMVFNDGLKKCVSERGRKSDGSKLPLLKLPVPGIKGWGIQNENSFTDEDANPFTGGIGIGDGAVEQEMSTLPRLYYSVGLEEETPAAQTLFRQLKDFPYYKTLSTIYLINR